MITNTEHDRRWQLAGGSQDPVCLAEVPGMHGGRSNICFPKARAAGGEREETDAAEPLEAS